MLWRIWRGHLINCISDMRYRRRTGTITILGADTCGTGKIAMNTTSIKRPKPGSYAKPPPYREAIVFAYANTVYGNP